MYKIYAEKHQWAGYVDDFVYDIKRKNTVNHTIAPSFRKKISRLNSQEIGVRRQITQKFKPNIKSELKELNIEI